MTVRSEAGVGARGDAGLGLKTWYLRQVDVFRGVPDEDLEAIGREVALERFGPGQIIMGPDTPGTRVFVVKEGVVRLFQRGPDGREVTAEVLRRGHLFGADPLFGAASASALGAAAVTDVVVCVTTRQETLERLQRWPQVLFGLVTQLGLGSSTRSGG